MVTNPDARKIVRLNDRIKAVVEPVDPEAFDPAGDRTLVRVEVVELLLARELVEDEA